MLKLNNVQFIGNLGAEPEVKYIPSGAPVAQLNLAVTREFKPDTAEDYETDWFTIIAWNKQAEFAQKWLKKGARVYVEARAQQRSWIDSESGKKRSVVEFVASRIKFADSKPKENGESTGPAAAEHGTPDDDETDPFADKE